MKEEVSAGIILFNDNEDRKFLLLNYPSKHWDFVKGKMEKDETPHETALRETKEETKIWIAMFSQGCQISLVYQGFPNVFPRFSQGFPGCSHGYPLNGCVFLH